MNTHDIILVIVSCVISNAFWRMRLLETNKPTTVADLHIVVAANQVKAEDRMDKIAEEAQEEIDAIRKQVNELAESTVQAIDSLKTA